MWIFWTIVSVIIGIALMIYSWTGDVWQGSAGMWSTIAIIIAVIVLKYKHFISLNLMPFDVYLRQHRVKNYIGQWSTD